MKEDFQFEYTHYPRKHVNDEPQPGHQVIVYEVEEGRSGTTILAAVGNLSHMRLLEEATDQRFTEWPKVALPKRFDHSFLTVAGWWRYTPDSEGKVAEVVACALDEKEASVEYEDAEEFTRLIGFTALAAAKYSMEVQAFRSGERYSGYVTPKMLQEVYEQVALGSARVVK